MSIVCLFPECFTVVIFSINTAVCVSVLFLFHKFRQIDPIPSTKYFPHVSEESELKQIGNNWRKKKRNSVALALGLFVCPAVCPVLPGFAHGKVQEYNKSKEKLNVV